MVRAGGFIGSVGLAERVCRFKLVKDTGCPFGSCSAYQSIAIACTSTSGKRFGFKRLAPENALDSGWGSECLERSESKTSVMSNHSAPHHPWTSQSVCACVLYTHISYTVFAPQITSRQPSACRYASVLPGLRSPSVLQFGAHAEGWFATGYKSPKDCFKTLYT